MTKLDLPTYTSKNRLLRPYIFYLIYFSTSPIIEKHSLNMPFTLGACRFQILSLQCWLCVTDWHHESTIPSKLDQSFALLCPTVCWSWLAEIEIKVDFCASHWRWETCNYHIPFSTGGWSALEQGPSRVKNKWPCSLQPGQPQAKGRCSAWGKCIIQARQTRHWWVRPSVLCMHAILGSSLDWQNWHSWMSGDASPARNVTSWDETRSPCASAM